MGISGEFGDWQIKEQPKHIGPDPKGLLVVGGILAGFYLMQLAMVGFVAENQDFTKACLKAVGIRLDNKTTEVVPLSQSNGISFHPS